jgi:hypothetical protein
MNRRDVDLQKRGNGLRAPAFANDPFGYSAHERYIAEIAIARQVTNCDFLYITYCVFRNKLHI